MWRNIANVLEGKIQSCKGDVELKMTGGGAVKYWDLVSSAVGTTARVTKVDEMESLANGLR